MFTVLKIERQVIYNFLTILMLELIFDREGIPLVDFHIIQYSFGLRGRGGESAPSPSPGRVLYTIYFKRYNIYKQTYRVGKAAI